METTKKIMIGLRLRVYVRRDIRIKPISFNVARGEVLGIAGLVGVGSF